MYTMHKVYEHTHTEQQNMCVCECVWNDNAPHKNHMPSLMPAPGTRSFFLEDMVRVTQVIPNAM